MPLSDYAREMRALIGNRQLLLPSVTTLVWDEGRLLMVANIETGLWQTVGGAVEPGEDPREAAVREAAEETGLTVALTGICGVTGGPEFQFTYPNGHRVAFAGIIFDAEATGGELLTDGDGDEVSAARFWPVAELREAAQMSDLTRALLIRAGVFSPD